MTNMPLPSGTVTPQVPSCCKHLFLLQHMLTLLRHNPRFHMCAVLARTQQLALCDAIVSCAKGIAAVRDLRALSVCFLFAAS